MSIRHRYPSPSQVASPRRAVDKALTGRNAQRLDPGVYPVILEPQAVGDILGFFRGAFFARSADEGRSPMSAPDGKTLLGQPVFDPKINLYSDPWHPELPGSQSAQDGLPAEKLYLIRGGAVENLIYSRFWAQKMGRQPTRGPVNQILESAGQTHSLADMIANTERALLLTRFWYIRMVNPRTPLLTGLTRDGVWLVEKGKIKHAVRNFRFNQSVMQMLAPGNVVMIGRPERVGGEGGRGGSLFPALNLKAFTFSSARTQYSEALQPFFSAHFRKIRDTAKCRAPTATHPSFQTPARFHEPTHPLPLPRGGAERRARDCSSLRPGVASHRVLRQTEAACLKQARL